MEEVAGFWLTPFVKPPRVPFKVMIGYHAHKAGPVGDTKDEAMMKLTRFGANYNYLRRDVQMVSVGPHIVGAVMPHPDTNPDSGTKGATKRFIAKTPTPDPELLCEFQLFVRKSLHSERWGDPLPMDFDDSFDTWIETTNYPRRRKEDLRKVWEALDDIDATELRDTYATKSFLKDEVYTLYKHARAINSRSDIFKVYASPLFTGIEKEVFKAREFIKKIPVRDRPQYILDQIDIPGAFIGNTDFSRFEAAFSQPVMFACEFELYRYSVRHTTEGQKWFFHVTQALGGGR